MLAAAIMEWIPHGGIYEAEAGALRLEGCERARGRVMEECTSIKCKPGRLLCVTSESIQLQRLGT